MEGEEQMEEEPVQVKRQKVLERCKFWPACKSGDECVYHHPTTQCKYVHTHTLVIFCKVCVCVYNLCVCVCRTFPSCVYGEKCLFIHPNCKYDSKCSKPSCPYTHVSHRALLQPPKPGAFKIYIRSGCGLYQKGVPFSQNITVCRLLFFLGLVYITQDTL